MTVARALAYLWALPTTMIGQCERWGPLFLPAYALASLWALARGASPYRDNRFERQAFGIGDRGTARPAI